MCFYVRARVCECGLLRIYVIVGNIWWQNSMSIIIHNGVIVLQPYLKKNAEKLDTFAILVYRNLNFVKNILREYFFHIQYI